ncbi:MAG: phage terminase large subunit [Eubacteriales bacterium]
MNKPISGQSSNEENLHNLKQLLTQVQLGRVNLTGLTTSDQSLLKKLLTPKMTKYIIHTPTPKQAAFMLLDCKEAFYGGAAGGGKSDALLMCALQYVDVPGYSAIIFRKSYADLTKPGALMDRAKAWLLPFKNVRWEEKDKKFTFYQEGSKIPLSTLQFGYLETANDRYHYQGGEYQFVGFDELTHISKTNYEYLFSRLRRIKGMEVPLRVRGASNPPDEDGGEWVRQRFVEEGPEKGRIFIPAGLDDNPFLDKEEYESSLAELDPVTRARLREGDWSVVRKGNMFKRGMFELVEVLPPNRRTVRWWDMAATDEEKAKKKNRSNEPDYTASMKVSESNGIYYIEDIIRERKSPENTEKLQHSTAISDGYRVAIVEEQEPGSSGIAIISSKSRSIFKGYNYRGLASSGSKTDRASLASAAAGNGNIKIYRGVRNLDAFFNEAESFPGGNHDDMVDCLSGAIMMLGMTSSPGIPITVESNEAHSTWLLEDTADGDYASYYESEDVMSSRQGYFTSFNSKEGDYYG